MPSAGIKPILREDRAAVESDLRGARNMFRERYWVNAKEGPWRQKLSKGFLRPFVPIHVFPTREPLMLGRQGFSLNALVSQELLRALTDAL
jgi:hypothetical protein